MVKTVTEKLLKLRMKLLRAWVQGKSNKAIRLQHKLLEEELKRRNNGRV